MLGGGGAGRFFHVMRAMTTIKQHLFKSAEIFYLMFYHSHKGRTIDSRAAPIL